VPGQGIRSHSHFQSLRELGKVLLGQSKIDKHLIEHLQRHHLLTGIDHLPDIHSPNADLSVERRPHFLLCNHRPHLVDAGCFLFVFRFHCIELGF